MKTLGLALIGGACYVVGLNIARLFPHPEYIASWEKITIALCIVLFGVFLVVKK